MPAMSDRHARPSAALLLAAVLALLLAPGCAARRSQPGVLLASSPPGAAVYVNGRATGFVTPAALSLQRARWHRVDFLLPGHRPATRLLSPSQRVHVIPWYQGHIGVWTWWFPLFLNLEDLLIPFRVDDNLSPQRIHVRLATVDDQT
jgi:hypothetical protein